MYVWYISLINEKTTNTAIPIYIYHNLNEFYHGSELA